MSLRRWGLAWRKPRPQGEDPENEERARQARANMRAFDRLGPQARGAIRESRFDAPADDVMRRWGGPYADDERVAARVRTEDDSHSGRFGPAYPAGI